MRSAAAALATVILLALLALGLNVLRAPQYTPDGLAYARYAARDAGASERDATLAARAFYERTPLMNDARYRSLVLIDPSIAFARSRIFTNRVLYPWLVALLLPAAGFRSLFLVSAIAYVCFGAALYWLLLAFGRPWLAAAFTLAALATPIVRSFAAADLTDMLALVWWTLALGAIFRGMWERRARWPALLAIVSILFVLTRPTAYTIAVPALAAAMVSGSWLLFAASLSGVVTFVAVAVATHAFGVREQLQWVYLHDQPRTRAAVPEGTWYRHALAASVRSTASTALRSVFPVLAALACAAGLRRRRTRRVAIVLFAAAASCFVSVAFNPVPSSLVRVVFLPLVPVICVVFQCVAEGALARLPNSKRRNERLAADQHRPPFRASARAQGASLTTPGKPG
jgi:hypothetical protein